MVEPSSMTKFAASAVRPDRQRVGVQIRVGDHAIGACPALDDVAAVAGEPLEAVVAGPAVHGVVVPLASEEVVAVAADQQVLTGAAEQGVVVGAAVEPVAAAAAVEQVVAAIPFELVGPVRPGQVVVVRAPDERGRGRSLIDELVVAVAALESRIGGDARLDRDHVIARPAVRHDMADAGVGPLEPEGGSPRPSRCHRTGSRRG